MTEPQLVVFDLPTVRIAALTWGPENGRLALCVHGFPDSAHSWRHIAPLLASEGFRVVAPFARGYGPTGPAADADYHMGALMSDLIGLHSQCGGGDDAVLIGHDWGAWTCNALAAYPGSPFSSYVSLALPPVGCLGVSANSLRRNLTMAVTQLRMSWYILFFQLPFFPERVLHRVIPRLWKDWSPAAVDVDEDVARTLAALPTSAHRRAAVGYYRAMFRFTKAGTNYVGLQRFRFKVPQKPLLILHGEQDGAMQVGYLDHVLSALPPGSRTRRIPGAGHFVQLDQPRLVSSAIMDYLATA